jgi:outer membrane protein W
VNLTRRILLIVVAALVAVMMAAGPSAAKAEAKNCVKAKAGGVVPKVCGKKATTKAGGARAHS